MSDNSCCHGSTALSVGNQEVRSEYPSVTVHRVFLSPVWKLWGVTADSLPAQHDDCGHIRMLCCGCGRRRVFSVTLHGGFIVHATDAPTSCGPVIVCIDEEAGCKASWRGWNNSWAEWDPASNWEKKARMHQPAWLFILICTRLDVVLDQFACNLWCVLGEFSGLSVFRKQMAAAGWRNPPFHQIGSSLSPRWRHRCPWFSWQRSTKMEKGSQREQSPRETVQRQMRIDNKV